MILLTGALGFIGSRTVRALVDLGQPCLALTRRDVHSPFEDLADRVTVAQADPADAASLRQAGDGRRITGIVHLATPSFGADGVRSTVDGLLNLLDAAREWDVPRVAVASTLSVYEGVPEVPHREHARLPLPVQPVPAVMLAKELVGMLAAEGRQVVNLRIATIWGPGNRWRDAVVNTLTYAAVRGEPMPPIHADDGADLCYVADCARAIALLMGAETLHHSTYNVGTGRPTRPAQVRDALTRIVPDADLPLVPGRDPTGPGHDTWLDITRLREDTGYQPTYDLDTGLREYVDHLRAGNPL
ncbi:MAG TPA: NAD(P)-dependent oxidoreductase [Mycobacteriales bacterium]|nr:NAD(P)-dependent oxidoreductase [Mycobacteriales bacterium]